MQGGAEPPSRGAPGQVVPTMILGKPVVALPQTTLMFVPKDEHSGATPDRELWEADVPPAARNEVGW